MGSISKAELERYMNKIFSYKIVSQINEIFFTKLKDYNSIEEYFRAIEDTMKRGSKIGFYLTFPMLIRWMKDENKNK